MHHSRPPRSPGPSRPPPSPPSRTHLPPPHTTSPPPTSSSQPPHPPHHGQHTSLPPIRQLYLPPPAPNMPPPYPYPSSGVPYQPPQHIAPGHSREADIYGTGESEPDDLTEPHGPPKKKRRRQALSCTECKRRKIKCDRSQPCAPCTRRGEQAKCQWHVVEPIEKYVTRAEYDELKARFDQLSALVDRLLAHIQTPGGGAALGATSEAVSTYAGVSPSQPYPHHHHPLMPPPHSYPQPHITTAAGETSAAQAPPQAHRYSSKGEPSEVVGMGGHGVGSPPGTAARAPVTEGASPALASARPSMNRSPTSTAARPKSSPLSLAAITSPFTPSDHAAQSKNCRAQTFILGERLRPGSRVLGDPVTLTPRLRRQCIRRNHTLMIGIPTSFYTRLRRASAGSAI